MASTLKERILNLRVTRGVIAECAGITRPELSDFLRNEALLSRPKTARLMTAVDNLEWFIQNIVPLINAQITPMQADMHDAVGIARILNLPETQAARIAATQETANV